MARQGAARQGKGHGMAPHRLLAPEKEARPRHRPRHPSGSEGGSKASGPREMRTKGSSSSVSGWLAASGGADVDSSAVSAALAIGCHPKRRHPQCSLVVHVAACHAACRHSQREGQKALAGQMYLLHTPVRLFILKYYPGGFGSLVKYPALVLHYSGGCCCCVFVHKLQGEVTTAHVDTCTVY